MNSLNLSRVAISLVVKLPAQVIEQHSVASPYIVGEEIARQVAEHVHQAHLGYYPALDYFRNTNLVEKELFTAVESISWLVCGLVREEIQARLRPIFSRLDFNSIQTVAYTMPSIRPSTRNALHDLMLHYTPDQVRVNMLATSIRRVENDPAAEIKLVKGQVIRWLKDSFSHMELKTIRVLDKNDAD